MELIEKSAFGEKTLKRHGKDWLIVSTDERTYLLKSLKTKQEMRVLIDTDPNFYKVTQTSLEVD